MIPSIGAAALKKRAALRNSCLIPNPNARCFASLPIMSGWPSTQNSRRKSNRPRPDLTPPLKARNLVYAHLVITCRGKGGCGWQAPDPLRLGPSPPRRVRRPDLRKAHPRREMKAPWTDPALRELLALAALSAFGCGLALAHADFLFAAIFAAASAAVIVEALRRLR